MRLYCYPSDLQKIVFPAMAKITNTKYINITDFINFEKVKFNILENEVNFHEKLPEKFIISNEDLFSKLWNFDAIEESFKLIKKNFYKDTVVLLSIREPYEYLNSIYIQKILHEGNIIPPSDFFLSEDQYNIQKLKTMQSLQLIMMP